MPHSHPLTQTIMTSLQAASRPMSEKERIFVPHYLGTTKKFLNVSSHDRDKIIRENIKAFRSLTSSEVLEMCDHLIYSEMFDYINISGKLLTLLPQVRKDLTLEHMRAWIATTHGWAECDSLCQSCFTGEEAGERYEEWRTSITDFSRDSNLQIRRASLVLQVKPVRQINDHRLRNLAYETVGHLCPERHVLITKAVSWVLRSLTVQDKEEVLSYIEKNKAQLPGIAYRETMKKILTGRKNDRPALD